MVHKFGFSMTTRMAKDVARTIFSPLYFSPRGQACLSIPRLTLLVTLSFCRGKTCLLYIMILFTSSVSFMIMEGCFNSRISVLKKIARPRTMRCRSARLETPHKLDLPIASHSLASSNSQAADIKRAISDDSITERY